MPRRCFRSTWVRDRRKVTISRWFGPTGLTFFVRLLPRKKAAKRDYAISTKEFLSDDEGRVRGVKAVRLEWLKDPVTGRRTFKEIPDSEFEIESDLVLLAMGFLHPSSPVMDAFGVQTDMRGNAQAAYEGEDAFRTNVPKVFATGDCRRGQSLVVRALAEGRRCAEAVDKFLSGEQN